MPRFDPRRILSPVKSVVLRRAGLFPGQNDAFYAKKNFFLG
jgi:hypothetical protein